MKMMPKWYVNMTNFEGWPVRVLEVFWLSKPIDGHEDERPVQGAPVSVARSFLKACWKIQLTIVVHVVSVPSSVRKANVSLAGIRHTGKAVVQSANATL